jgi:hypothetical protein
MKNRSFVIENQSNFLVQLIAKWQKTEKLGMFILN